MTLARNGGRRVRPAAPAAALLVLALVTAGCSGAQVGGEAASSAVTSTAPVPTGSPATATPAATVPEATPPPPTPIAVTDIADPVTVRVPDVGITGSLGPLGLDPGGRLEAPVDFALAGWYRAGPEPGERGVAVIAGHVDSRAGPAVFYSLADVTPGAAVFVDRADGTVAEFTVTVVERYPKDSFPTDRVYTASDRSELRLITCGGEFDREARSYRDNIVVFADLVERSQP